ncbi:carbohydrate kinase family protein [archaeon]|jgi:sugar/nucleoside kinase (ribokinase family)|nr:carbohydrate kinase family protein [archaeon]MBT4397570.1 carbohydrate kinase family protein [archaeon]MBT4440825.1 carbohydrate kinase family protein [archaeon]
MDSRFQNNWVVGNTTLDIVTPYHETNYSRVAAEISGSEDPVQTFVDRFGGEATTWVGGPGFNTASYLSGRVTKLAVLTVLGRCKDQYAAAARRAYEALELADIGGILKDTGNMSRCAYLLGNMSKDQVRTWYDQRASRRFDRLKADDFRQAIALTDVFHLPTTHPGFARDILTSEHFDRGFVVYTPGPRLGTLENPTFDESLFDDIVDYSSLLFLNETEAQIVADNLYDGDTEALPKLFARKLSPLSLIVVTKGSKGSTIYTGGDKHDFSLTSGMVVANPINPAGAGDAYSVKFTLDVLAGSSPLDAARSAHAFAAEILERPGASEFRITPDGRLYRSGQLVQLEETIDELSVEGLDGDGTFLKVQTGTG